MAKAEKIRIERDGRFELSTSLLSELGWKPYDEIRIIPEKNGLRIEKISNDDPYDKFLELLEQGLKGVIWREIEAERNEGSRTG
jgi:hypothetical protein